MAAHPLVRLEASTRVLKRAQYEAFEFELHDDALLVRNGSHPDPENHEYEVAVTNGVPTHCECPADENYEGACKHRVAVAIRTPVLEAAVHTRLAADGSGTSDQPLTEAEYLSAKDSARSPDESEESADNDASSEKDVDKEELPCECDDLTDDFPCWNCVLADRRSLPDQ